MMWLQKPPLGVPLDWSNPLNKGLVMHLAANEGHGDHLNDLSMNGNHGTIQNMAFPSTAASGWNPGRAGVGLNYDGTNDYVDCGNNLSLDITDAITLSAWVVPTATTTGFIFSKYDDANNRIELVMASTYFIVTFGNGITYKSAKYTVAPVVGKAYCVIGTYTAGGDIKIFVNGVKGEVSETLAGGISIISNPLLIGSRRGIAYFNGSIDQARILNRAYTAKEVMDYAMNPWGVYLDEDD